MEEDDTILYDILEPCEWTPNTEIIPGEVPKSLWKSLATTAKGCVNYGVQKITYSLRSIPPLSICQLLANTISWKIALSSDGNLLAVLQEGHVELRCLDDDFVIAIAKCSVSADGHPQWRKMAWNEESTCLAVANSSGEVFVFSSNGQRLCHIERKASEEKDISQAASGLSFAPVSSQHTSSSVAQLIVTSVSGLLSCYVIKSSGQYSLLHTFNFTSHYPYGVGSVLYHPQHHILIVAAVNNEVADGVSLSKWRELDSAPHYAMVEGGELVKKSSSILSSFGQLLPYQQANNNNSWVFNMVLSPNGSALATIDVSGNISLYEVPSLRLRKQWSVEEQFNALHAKEDIPLSGSPAKLNKNDLPRPLDISWWSDQALVVINNQGSLTVSSIQSFDNLLGASAEKCEPLVCLTSAHNSSFLFLECEQNTTSMTTPLESVTGSIDLAESEDISPTKRAFKHLLYSVTELERFQPPRKKPRVISRTYRLVCLKSTTPQELYRRKIDNEEYGDALQLARTYQLDCDLVYQQQWSNSIISKATIEDYLSRITKQQWVMSECLYRVTDDYNAMNDLLKYGLIRTNISQVVPDLSTEMTGTQLMEEVLRGIERFSDDQLFLVMCRIKLLNYLDRLSLMQEILGGPVATDEKFSGADFHSFRDRNVVELAIDYAQQGNWKAVDLLFSYHGNHTLPHRLAILSNFPETISPEDYASLLPAVNTSGVLILWQQKSWRDSCDWCELEACKRLLPLEDQHSESGEFLYLQSPQLSKYKSATDHDILSMWYHERAREIEKLSGEVLNSLSLIEIAEDFGIKGTAVIHDDLLTLKSIVFERGVDTRMCLANLEKMTPSEKLGLLMKQVEPDSFADYFQKYATPFLQRQEANHPGTSEQLLTDYLSVLAKDDLQSCLYIFQTAHSKHPAHPLLTDTVKLIPLILNCVYSCERTDQLSVADQIFECIPEEKDSDSTDLVQLHRKVDALDNHLHAVELLKQYEIEKPIVYIRTIEENANEAEKLMIRIARSASRRKPPLKELDWLKLSEQLLGLQKNIFKSLKESICYKIIGESLLSSGLQSNITLGGQLLAHSSHQQPVQLDSVSSEESVKKLVSTFVCKIPFRTSVELVLSAAREYFNSASDPADHEMNLAWHCLNLIEEVVDDIVTERQLIEAVGILATCQVTIIPVQVRLCEHKLDIVKQALQSSPALYKNSAKVLKLAKLLGLKSAKDDGEGTLTGELGQAMILMVQTAMKHLEYDIALEICHRLMSTPTPDAWSVCSDLAAGEKIQDLHIKTSLLQFAVTHCPISEMKRILHLLRTVETECLYQQCTSSDAQSTGHSGVLRMMGYGAVQQLVTKSTGIVQNLIKPDVQSGDGSKMSSYLNWMSSAATALNDYWKSTAEQLSTSPKLSSSSSEKHSLTSSQLVQSCHPFYDDNLTTSSLRGYVVLQPMERPSGTLQLNQAILRTTLLLSDYSQPSSDVSEILLSMAQSCATTNLPLFLAYLFTLPDPMMAKTLFQRFEPTMFTLHVAIYYVCLQIYVLVNDCDSSLYLLPPATVVGHVTSHMTVNHSDWPEKAKELFEFLKELNTQLGDLMQGKTLQEFDLEIDVEKFTQDAAYKHRVILMLVRSINSTYISTGIKLANRYQVPKWEVFMEHLDWLFTESRLTNQAMQNHISQLGVDDVALQKPQETVDHLMTGVYPKIAGTDHNSLLVCLCLVEKCVGRGAKDTQLVDVSTQIRLLKKFKTSLQAMDFKAVMCGQNPLMVFQPHLTSENVHVVAKVAGKIPLSSGDRLQASDIFKTFAEKLFWDTKPNTKDIDWLHRLKHCQEYLERLSTTAYENVIKKFTISPMALELVPADVRTKIVLECIKFSRSKSCKMDGLEVKLQQLMQHLKIVNDTTVVALANKEEWKSLYEEFAMSDSDTDKIHKLVIKMLMAGLDQQLINNVLTLSHSVIPHSLQMSSLVCEALETSLNQLSIDKFPNKEAMLAIGNILQSCQKSPEATLVDIVLNILSDYYKSCDHSADNRIAVLELIEQTNALPPSDIVQYKTEAILCDQFDVKIDHDHMTSCDDRHSLLEQLLTQAVNMDQLLTIVKLLQAWPDPVTTHVTSWANLLVQLSLQPNGCGHALLVRAGLEGIPLEADVKLYENLSHDFPVAFKIAIMSRQESLFHRAMEDAKLQFKELASDHNILELLICCEQVHNIVSSPLYSSLHQYLLLESPNCDNLSLPLFTALLHCRKEEVEQKLNLHNPMDRVRTVAEQLYNRGYWLEAGTLLLKSHRTHPALVTTGNAVSMLHKLFKK